MLTTHAATESDLRTVTQLVAQIHGAPDSGAELLNRLGEPAVAFTARPFRSGSVWGEWVAAPGSGTDSVLLYLHARRFQFDEPPAVFAGRLAAATGLPVLHLHYRLAPEHPYPAALDDVLEAYQALLDQGTPASRIVLVGHSAGATLALSALLAIRDRDHDHGRSRPLPAAAVAISPLTDFTHGGASVAANDGRDVISTAELQQVTSAYLGSADPAGSPQSPLAGDLASLPPLLMACGDAEVLRDDTVRFAAKARAAGVQVDLEVFEGMPHGFAVLSLDSSRLLLDRVATYIADHLAGLSGHPTGTSSPSSTPATTTAVRRSS